MKKLLIVLFVMVFCAGAANAAVPSPSTPMLQLPDGSIVSATNPLPVTSSGGGTNVTEILHNTQELTANTIATITSSLTADARKFVEITAMSSTQEFWIQIDGAKPPVIAECRLCVGGVYLELPKTAEIGIIASETITINVVEGGY